MAQVAVPHRLAIDVQLDNVDAEPRLLAANHTRALLQHGRHQRLRMEVVQLNASANDTSVATQMVLCTASYLMTMAASKAFRTL